MKIINEYDEGYHDAMKENTVVINGLKTTIERMEAQGIKLVERIKELETELEKFKKFYDLKSKSHAGLLADNSKLASDLAFYKWRYENPDSEL